MTSPRIIVSGATTAITRRTTLRKAFLGPWDPLVQQCWLYALADAQRHTEVAIHHGILVVNHEHLIVTPSYDNLPEFVRRAHRDMSCAINTLLAQHRYDAPRELFDGRAPHYQRLCDDASQAVRLLYDHANCVAAGLVERPEHMPDYTFHFDLWRKGYLDVHRPAVYFGDNERARPEVIRMAVTPPPLLFEAFEGDLERLIYHLQRLREESIKKARTRRLKPALGARALRRLHPWSEPRSLRERGGQRVPTFSIGTRGPLAREENIRAATEVRSFRATHRHVRIERRNGNDQRRYPFGSYAVRVVHGTPVEAHAHPDAIVSKPGPLLCDVQARVRERRKEPPLRSFDLLTEVRASFEDDAKFQVHDDGMEFAREEVAPPSGRAVLTRHRFDPDDPLPQESGATAPARRLVILRDRRMGRPPRASSRHGADPPR